MESSSVPPPRPGAETRWRCASCGAEFGDERPSPRCPKCLKQSRVERAPATTPRGGARSPAPSPASPSPARVAAPEAPGPAEEDAGRTIPLAFGFAVMPGICAAFLASGWFVDMELNPMAAVVLALVGTPIAGWVAGRDLVDRVFATLAAAVTAVGIVMATAWYVRGRHASGNFELLLPMLLGALPGLGALLAFRALAPRPLPRVAAAVAALVATVVVIAAY